MKEEQEAANGTENPYVRHLRALSTLAAEYHKIRLIFDERTLQTEVRWFPVEGEDAKKNVSSANDYLTKHGFEDPRELRRLWMVADDQTRTLFHILDEKICEYAALFKGNPDMTEGRRESDPLLIGIQTVQREYSLMVMMREKLTFLLH